MILRHALITAACLGIFILGFALGRIKQPPSNSDAAAMAVLDSVGECDKLLNECIETATGLAEAGKRCQDIATEAISTATEAAEGLALCITELRKEKEK